ncbi:aspartate kinase [Hanseniaspora valbyensis NRRL Y-1626]|uniref:Aspartokinase n=1 Tax=Hanseniaspora valbyensis NRRL Y-1626 TaxID=766949 RepID=A0A1B7THQ0_9ASCO|nr:aspartate kinase [Hanseniaspora valbyensis NRRL Y-1626]
MVHQEESNWIVQKFGGTSIGKFHDNIVNDIIKNYSQDQLKKVMVVCSARSTYNKEEGTTSRIMNICDLIQQSNLSLDATNESNVNELIRLIKDDHINNAKLNIKDLELQKELIDVTIDEFKKIESYINASMILGEVSIRTKDLLLSLGEKLSCLFVAIKCRDEGLDTEYVDLSNIIENEDDGEYKFNKDGTLDSDFYSILVKKLRLRLKAIVDYNNNEAKPGQYKIPIITGFFGFLPNGLLQSIGRGYTDLAAALVAIAIDSDELQIWKEVDGIFTADPRKVKNARLLKTVTPLEASELTYYGSEVIHPFTMEQVIKARIPIRIKNVQNPIGEGTIIYPDNMGRKGVDTPPHPPAKLESAVNLLIQKALTEAGNTRRKATAITAKKDIIVLNIHSNKKTLSHGFLANIFTILDEYKLVVDLISTSEVYISMAIPIPDVNSLKLLKLSVKKLEKFGDVEVVKNLAIISLVGKEMKNFIGIAGTMFKTLAEAEVNIEMISQGANEINISCVIEESQVIKALNAIHDNLLN